MLHSTSLSTITSPIPGVVQKSWVKSDSNELTTISQYENTIQLLTMAHVLLCTFTLSPILLGDVSTKQQTKRAMFKAPGRPFKNWLAKNGVPGLWTVLSSPICIYVSMYPVSIYVSIYLSIHRSIYLSLSLSSSYLSIYLCIYVCMYVCIYLSIYPSI